MRRISLILALVMLPLVLLSQVVEERVCLDCHKSGSWFPLSDTPSFDHNTATDFRLEYSHKDLACTQCHSSESIEAFHQFNTKGTACSNCHQDIHQNYWGNACETCHSPENWDIGQAFRRHDETLFPLQVGHHLMDCYLCHTSPGKIPSLDCQSCHDVEFQPELEAHDGLTSQMDCSICHAPTRWNQILAINHDTFFPIHSGRHRWVWDSCSTCHTASGDYQTFSCLGSGCHSVAHMNSEHCEGSGCERRNGLTYPSSGVDSEDCYYCHPRGNE